jgi:hypothetical protein
MARNFGGVADCNIGKVSFYTQNIASICTSTNNVFFSNSAVNRAITATLRTGTRRKPTAPSPVSAMGQEVFQL